MDSGGNPYPYGYPPPGSTPYSYPPLHPSHSFSGEQHQQTTNSGAFPYPPPPYTGSQPPYPPAYPIPSYPPPPHVYPSTGPPSAPPLDPNPPHRPALHQHNSFQYDGYPYQQFGQYPPEIPRPPPRSESFSGYHHQDFSGYQRQDSSAAPQTAANYPPVSVDHFGNPVRFGDPPTSYGPPPPPSSSTMTTPSVYPLNDRLENVRLSDHPSSAVGSPSVLSPSVSSHDRPGMYSHPNYSFPASFSPQVPSAPSAPRPHSGSQQGTMTQIVPFQPSKLSLKVLLLHGSLDIIVVAAKNLPNKDMFSKTIVDIIGPGLLKNLSGKLEEHSMSSVTSDPYVTFSVSNAVLGRTYVISNSENPVWNQHFYVPVAHYGSEVCFAVKDSDVVGSQLIGTVVIPAERIYDGSKVEGIYPVLGTNGKPYKRNATLQLSIQYIPAELLAMYHHGVGPAYNGISGTYFPHRKGGNVKLYQDAHVPDGCLPDIRLENGMAYEHGRCWEDIFNAISQARRLVYITGWSVYHNVQLVRHGQNGSVSMLGELLKLKSQEGVRVLLLVWDDPTSRNIIGIRTDGLMKTHDEETARFFKHSSVKVLLCPRSAGKRHSWAKQREVETIYTHHQKTVIVDADAGNNWRKIVAFVGGLDLCDGRYDTPEHAIFRTLQTLHKDDYHNPTFTGTSVNGPREPWHDLHSKIEGSAAYDVLKNFEERWMKASKPHGIKKLKRSDDALLLIGRISDIIGIDDSVCRRDNDPETWHVQIFRSIDSNSVKGFPKDPKEATGKNLVCGKNVLIDMSIHTAYVTAIRAAQHFVYIENQYFLGSSYNWASYREYGANNLIPMEIALKIAKKIKANERFSAYIVIPMWPEGDPKSLPMQRILCWQKETMQMMYETIYQALVEAGLENRYSPQDYLNFFCLGNREAADRNDTDSLSSPNAPNALSRKSRRFMIYVHSKGMIVDDEYVILGSANINQRSLEGSRDTEIAMGAYQPYHSWAEKPSGPRGQIYGYRMSLWAEHLGFLEEGFDHPESLDCMRRIRALGEMNWAQFFSDQVTEMRGHLLKYPVAVDQTGKVNPLPDCKEFPDVGGKICGNVVGPVENLTT